MYAIGSRLAQIRPGDTNIATAFTATLDTEITLITVTASAGAASTFRIYHVDEGGTASVTNVLFWNVAVAADETFIFQAQAPGTGIQLARGDFLAVRAGAADNVTFNVYGVTETLAESTRVTRTVG